MNLCPYVVHLLQTCDRRFAHTIVSFASLVGNANALTDLACVLKSAPNVRGEIYGMDSVITGMAVDEKGADVGRYIVLEVELPRK